MFGPLPPANALSCISMHCSYSGSVMPFHAKTGTPVFAMAAAAWSCVEKMLQLVQVTSAPSAVSVSMRTAVWMVMWKAARDARALERPSPRRTPCGAT